jgi:hypothetical protein
MPKRKKKSKNIVDKLKDRELGIRKIFFFNISLKVYSKSTGSCQSETSTTANESRGAV